MKKFVNVIALLAMIILSLGIISSTEVTAEEYEPVMIDKLSEREYFFASYNGVQYLDALYYYNQYDYKIMKYTNEMAAEGIEPECFADNISEFSFNDASFYYLNNSNELYILNMENGNKELICDCAYDVAVNDNYVAYTIFATKELHLYNPLDKSDKVIVTNAYFVYTTDDNTVFSYLEPYSSEDKYIDIDGNPVDINATTYGTAPNFKKTSKMKKVSTFCVDGTWYAGVKLKTGNYSLYKYNGTKYTKIVSSTKVNTTQCYNLNNTPCFIRKKYKSNTLFYQLQDDKLVKVGSYSYSKLFGQEEYDISILDGKYLKIKAMDEYNDYIYVFDEYFTLLFQQDVNVEEGYLFRYKNGNIYYDSLEYEWLEAEDAYLYATEEDYPPEGYKRYVIINIEEPSFEASGEKRYYNDSYLGGVLDYDKDFYRAISSYTGKWYNSDIEEGIAGLYIYSDGFASLVYPNGAVSPMVLDCYVEDGKLNVDGELLTLENGVLVDKDGTRYSKVTNGYPNFNMAEDFAGDWKYIDEDSEITDNGIIINSDGTYSIYTNSKETSKGTVKSISNNCIALVSSKTKKVTRYLWMDYSDALYESKKSNGTFTDMLKRYNPEDFEAKG